MNTAGKIHIMGAWYSLDDIRTCLAKATSLPEDEFDWDELTDTVEYIAKRNPTAFSRFSREMYNVRFGSKRNDTVR